VQKFLIFIFLSVMFNGASANDVTVADKLKIAMSADSRPEQDRVRDRNRLPVETLAFFGLEESRPVVALIPGGGWYTRLLAPVLADKGNFYVAIMTDRVEKNIVGRDGFENNIKITARNAKGSYDQKQRRYLLDMTGLGVEQADMVLTFRNYHNFGTAARAAMNSAAYEALKPGGVYGVVDHTRRHMEADSPENRRRFDPVLAIKEIQAAGFELVDYSDLHYRADDELRYEVGRKTVTGNTDRWTLKFRKP
jgi:predicted methyltransferase